MLLQPVIDQVTATAGVGFLSGGFRRVMGAAGFADAQADLKVAPVAYVIPLGDTAQPNQLQGLSIEQHVIERFGVIIAASNVRDVRGEAVNPALEILRRATIDNLLGFVAATGYDPVQYGGGRLLLLDVSVIWWQVDFITGYYERKM